MAKADKNIKKAAAKKAEPVKAKPKVPASTKEILAKVNALVKKAAQDSSDSEESSSEDSDTNKKGKAPLKSAPAVKKPADDSSDSEESSSEENDTNKKGKAPVKTALAVKKTDDSSDSEDSSSEENDTSDKGKGPLKTAPAAAKYAAVDSDDSSSSSENEKSEANNKGKAPVKTPAAVQKPVDDSNSAEPSSEDDDEDQEMTSVPEKTYTNATQPSDSDEEDSDSNSDSDVDEDEETSSPQTAHTEANKKRKADPEETGPPKKVKLLNGNASATPSTEGTSIFVGRLSWNVDNDWLAEEFAECGQVESAHVQMDRNTGRSRGFGYVHFTTADAVEKALTMNGKEIDGRAVNIDRSTQGDKKTSMEKRAQTFGDVSSPPSAVLFVGNMSFGVSEDTLWEMFGEHGDIKSVRVPTDRDSGKPKGFAYVEFSEIDAAKKAHTALQGYELEGRSLRLDFSQPRDSAGGRGGGQGGRGGRGRGFGFGNDRGGRGAGRGGWGGRGGERGGRGGDRGGRGGDRGGRGRGRGARTGGITQFEGQKITFA